LLKQAFVLTHATFSLLPILIFVTFALSTLIFALATAILFTLFWTGVALLLLVPTLLVTSGIGLCVWAWFVSSFVALRWVYRLVYPTDKNTTMSGSQKPKALDDNKWASGPGVKMEKDSTKSNSAIDYTTAVNGKDDKTTVGEAEIL
jgi:hypothetical protein